MKDTNAVVPPASTSSVQSSVGPTKKQRGFAALPAEKVRELARLGGTAAHRAGTAHQFTTEEARAAGRKGGIAAHASPKALPAENHPQD